MQAVNMGIDQRLFNIIKNIIKETPYYRLIGIELLGVGPGYAELAVKTVDNHCNPLGLIHGGLLMSLGDAAMGNAIRSTGIKAVTVDCSTSFAAGAKLGEIVTAKGKVLKTGKNMVFARAEIYAGAKLLGDCKGTFFRIGEVS